MYSIKLGNGLELSEVKQNGSMLSTSEQISREDLAAGLGSVTISGKPDTEYDNDMCGEFHAMKVAYFRDSGNSRDFVLAPISPAELAEKQNRADIEYIAMMTGVQL